MSYSVNVQYPSQYYPRLDEVIRKRLRRYSEGSGMGLGERDLSFGYKSQAAALKAFAKLSKLTMLTHLSVGKDIDF